MSIGEGKVKKKNTKAY